jgi:hypothetical protein
MFIALRTNSKVTGSRLDRQAACIPVENPILVFVTVGRRSR